MSKTLQSPQLPARQEIRRFQTDGDFEDAASIMVSSDPWMRLGFDRAWSRRVLSNPDREPWGLWQDGRMAGFLLLCFQGPFVGYVQLLGVAADVRGQGLGARLLDHAERCIFERARNVFICVSSFNDGARRFYARQGYSEVGRLDNYLVQGFDEILLRKTLGPLLQR